MDDYYEKLRIAYGLDFHIKEANQTVDIPEKYIINKGATILIWKNGDKTVVKRCEDDEFNPRLGFLTAFFQRYCGMSKNKANKYLASLEVEGQNISNRKETKTIKFKIGDRVKVKNDLKEGKKYGVDNFTTSMKKYLGQIVTIDGVKNIRGSEAYRIKEDNARFCWTKEMFEIQKPKHMKEENDE